MSDAVATVLRFLQAVEHADEGGLTLVHEEIEVHDFDLPDAGIYRRGPGQVAGGLERSVGGVERARPRLPRPRAPGGHVEPSAVALFEMRNRGRGSGIELSGRWAEVWETRGTDVMGSRFFQSHEEAMTAAGMG